MTKMSGNRLSNLNGSHALIVGASTTIGEQFAYQLAANGLNLTLVARSEDMLQTIAKAVVETYGVKVTVMVCDLHQGGAVDVLIAGLEGVTIDLLVVNANLLNRFLR